jgi:tricorn protease-like protein
MTARASGIWSVTYSSGSTKTVEKHRQSLMNKLDIHDTAGLTRYAISAGIIESSVQLTVV